LKAAGTVANDWLNSRVINGATYSMFFGSSQVGSGLASHCLLLSDIAALMTSCSLISANRSSRQLGWATEKVGSGATAAQHSSGCSDPWELGIEKLEKVVSGQRRVSSDTVDPMIRSIRRGLCCNASTALDQNAVRLRSSFCNVLSWHCVWWCFQHNYI